MRLHFSALNAGSDKQSFSALNHGTKLKIGQDNVIKVKSEFNQDCFQSSKSIKRRLVNVDPDQRSRLGDWEFKNTAFMVLKSVLQISNHRNRFQCDDGPSVVACLNHLA